MRDYNFFESYQKKRSASINLKSPVFLGMIVILLILAFSAYCVAQNVILAARLVAASAELAEVQASKEYQEAIKLQDSISAMASYDQNAGMALDRIKEGSFLNTDFMKKLSASIPTTATIQSANVTRINADIYFNVPNEKTAAELLGDLEKSGLFLKSTLVSVTKNEDGTSFVAYINCILKAGEEK